MADISEDEVFRRVENLLDHDQTLHGVSDVDGETEYAHIYLASFSGTHNGNEMLWLNYVWLSKPDAYDNDMMGDNGISIRLVDGMETALRQQMIYTLAALGESGPDGQRFFQA